MSINLPRTLMNSAEFGGLCGTGRKEKWLPRGLGDYSFLVGRKRLSCTALAGRPLEETVRLRITVFHHIRRRLVEGRHLAGGGERPQAVSPLHGGVLPGKRVVAF